MLNVVNSHRAHKSQILMLVFSCVWGAISSYWKSQSGKNLETAVVERDPNIKSFFQFTQKLSSPLGPGRSFGLSETDLYIQEGCLLENFESHFQRIAKSKMSFAKHVTVHQRQYTACPQSPTFFCSGFKMSQSETIWNLPSCWEGFRAALIWCEHTSLLVSSPCWFYGYKAWLVD